MNKEKILGIITIIIFAVIIASYTIFGEDGLIDNIINLKAYNQDIHYAIYIFQNGNMYFHPYS